MTIITLIIKKKRWTSQSRHEIINQPFRRFCVSCERLRAKTAQSLSKATLTRPKAQRKPHHHRCSDDDDDDDDDDNEVKY